MKRYNDALDHVAFTPEEKQDLSARLREAAMEQVQPAHRQHPFRARKLVCSLIAAALAATTLTAAAVPAFGNALKDFFGIPVNSYEVGKSVERDGWTFTVQECLADDNMLYASLEVQLPDTFPVEELREELRDEGVTDLDDLLDGVYLYQNIIFPTAKDEDSAPFSAIEDSTCVNLDLDARTINFVCINQFYTSGQLSAALSDMKAFDLEIVQAGMHWPGSPDDVPLFSNNFSPVIIPDIPIHPVATIYLSPDQPVPIYGGTATLTDVSISPLFVTARVEGGSCYNHGAVMPTHPEYLNEGAGPLIAQGRLENTTCDCDFDLHLKYKDGRVVFIGNSWNNTIEPDYNIVNSWGGGFSCETGVDFKTRQPDGKAAYASTKVSFKVPQDLNQIQSVIVCGKEFPIR